MSTFQFSEVTAEVFHGFVNSGRTRPARFTCSDYSGERADYIVKFHGKLRSGCIQELVSYALGTALGIPVAKGAVVHVDPRLGDLNLELHEALSAGYGPHYGSAFATPGFRPFSSAEAIPAVLLPEAIDIFAWDMLIENVDRRRDNSNLLYHGETFLAIDHEQALGFGRYLFKPLDPWILRGQPPAEQHLFRLQLKGKVNNNSFDSFITRLDNLPDGSIEQILAAIPTSWQDNQVTSAIAAHINLIRANLELFRQGLLEVFA